MAFRKSFVTYKIKWKIFNLLSLKKILFFKGYFRKLAPTALRFCKDRDLTRIHFFYKQLSLSPSPQICLYFILLYFYSISWPIHSQCTLSLSPENIRKRAFGTNGLKNDSRAALQMFLKKNVQTFLPRVTFLMRSHSNLQIS